MLYGVGQFSSLFSKDKLKARGTHAPTPSISWENCRAVSSQQLAHALCGAALKVVFCICLSSKRPLRHGFSPLIEPTTMLSGA